MASLSGSRASHNRTPAAAGAGGQPNGQNPLQEEQEVSQNGGGNQGEVPLPPPPPPRGPGTDNTQSDSQTGNPGQCPHQQAAPRADHEERRENKLKFLESKARQQDRFQKPRNSSYMAQRYQAHMPLTHSSGARTP